MRDRARLISLEDKRLLYKKLENVLGQIFFDIHAIYEPDGDDPYGDCYTAAVDLFKEGLTFRIYFKCEPGEKLTVEYAERWYFG